jgi:hypothetical protein
MTPASTITSSIVCSREQLADVQARVSALQVDLHRLGVAFWVNTHHDPPPRPTMTLEAHPRFCNKGGIDDGDANSGSVELLPES